MQCNTSRTRHNKQRGKHCVLENNQIQKHAQKNWKWNTRMLQVVLNFMFVIFARRMMRSDARVHACLSTANLTFCCSKLHYVYVAFPVGCGDSHFLHTKMFCSSYTAIIRPADSSLNTVNRHPDRGRKVSAFQNQWVRHTVCVWGGGNIVCTLLLFETFWEFHLISATILWRVLYEHSKLIGCIYCHLFLSFN